MSAEMPKHPASVRYAIPEEIASGSGKSWMATRCRSPRRDSRRCASSITGEDAGAVDGSVTDGFVVIGGGPSERRASKPQGEKHRAAAKRRNSILCAVSVFLPSLVLIGWDWGSTAY